ncbi:MAG: quinone-dependent dihydroorotate dehydrogenase [Candidatus Nomurabacteria bacterium]|nr:quinone-dependent dihydroorotate dehydrogenase [Candidatus Nomurabacteria bacterium]
MISFIYKKIIKPILFLFPADDVHTFFLKRGYILGNLKYAKKLLGKILPYKNTILEQNILGIDFINPIGLSAGFDYNADLIGILPSVGFGFHTIGTVTNMPYQGNPKPMLDRLPRSKSLLVNKGFKSSGIDFVLKKINKKKKSIPLGISIGATNQSYKSIEDMTMDVYNCFEKSLAADYFDYFELNISCPNLINSQNLKEKFDDPIGFKILLDNLSKLNINKPLFLKMHAEKSIEDSLVLLSIANNYKWISGIIMSNLVKNRENKSFYKEEIVSAGRGNFSGKPTEEFSNNLISEVYKNYKGRFIIIGTGGVFSGVDAYEKIKRGANLVQMITGMVYEGPSVIGKINKELAVLLKKDGFNNIKEAIGTKKY